MRKTIWIVISIIIFSIVFCLLFFMHNNKEDREKTESIEGEQIDMERKMTVTINGEEFSATLEDNETVRELLTRLPLTIEMEDLNSNEKYYYLDESLPTDATNVGRIERGNIMLFGSDCLVLFYKSFETPYSYTRIGKIDDVDNLEEQFGQGSVRITFE